MSAGRAKGTAYENHVIETYLLPVWPGAHRAPQRGILDYGDVEGVGNYLIEMKKRDRWDLPEWIRGILRKIQRHPTSPWILVFAADKRGPIPMDLACMPAEQHFHQLRRLVQLEREVARLEQELLTQQQRGAA